MCTLLTQSLAVLMPFNVQELNDSTGNYYGINQISKNVNIGNRKKLINGNGFVFGVPGSGKSFFCKMEMGSVFLSGDDEIIVIDPMNEYFDIAETYGGTVVNMSTYTDNYVNPLEMDVWSLDPNDSKGMVREKGEFMLGLCEQCIGDSLNSRQKSIIDRCVRKLYIDIARSKEKYIPVMSDFYDILMAQPEDEAKDIALSLELFVNGSLNIFNHQTNVDVDNRFTVYGIRDLGTELSPITMLVMMESIQNRIVENGKRGKATWLYIDEFHVLLNSEYSAKYLQQLWKKVRKQGGLCTGITQNIVDFLQNYTATTMLANSEFVALLKQANTDSSKMAEVIGVSEAQLRFVTNTPSAYKKRKGSRNFFHAVEVKSLWSTSSIRDILNDEVYLGKLIWNKTKKRIGSNNTSSYVPKDEWMVIENCHEPIITQELFDMAHANSKKYIRPKRGKRNYNPFYYCGGCGRALAPSKRVKGDILLCLSSRIEKNSPCKSNRVEIAKVEDTIMKTVNMYATAYLDEKGIKKAGKSKEVSPEEKIATLEKKVKSLSSKKMMLYSDYKDDKLTREEYVKRSKAKVEQIDELHQEIEQLKTEIPTENNSSSKFETQLESIINMESFDREKIQKVIKKVIINGENNIEIVWNTDDPFFK